MHDLIHLAFSKEILLHKPSADWMIEVGVLLESLNCQLPIDGVQSTVAFNSVSWTNLKKIHKVRMTYSGLTNFILPTFPSSSAVGS